LPSHSTPQDGNKLKNTAGTSRFLPSIKRLRKTKLTTAYRWRFSSTAIGIALEAKLNSLSGT